MSRELLSKVGRGAIIKLRSSKLLGLVGLGLILLGVGLSGQAAETRTIKGNLLKPNDVVIVKVYQEEELETKAAIDRNGFLALPLLGRVNVGQKTTEEAMELIRGLYEKDYLINPQVSLSVFEKAKLRFTVMGQVQKPGTYEFPDNEPLNLLQGIAIAGRYTRLGAPNKITLQRVQDGKPVVLQLNAERMTKDKKTQPFELLPDDIITVGERIF